MIKESLDIQIIIDLAKNLKIIKRITVKKTNEDFIFHQTPYVIGNWLRGWEMNPPDQIDPKIFLDNVRESIHKKLVEELVELQSVKYQLALKINLKKEGPDGKEEFTDPVFRHKTEAVLNADDIKESLDKAIPNVIETFEKWTHRGSNWVVDKIQTLWLDIAKYKPFKGGSYIPFT